MTGKRGFTLVELMVVVLIVGILAAVALPLMSGRINSAKWSEANAAAGTIRTAARAYWAERGDATAWATAMTGAVGNWGPLIGIEAVDLDGRYFLSGCYTITDADGTTGNVEVTVGTGSPGPGGAPTSPTSKILSVDGTWQ
jgi:prepilin-type N-terminal cleavage/methylation domain-containing protein